MPIYAYKCASCGFAKDVLQKISDPALTECPQCGQAAFSKQVTAAGFQLKGSGWYVTDFRGGSGGASGSGSTATPAPASTSGATSASESTGSSAATPAAATPSE